MSQLEKSSGSVSISDSSDGSSFSSASSYFSSSSGSGCPEVTAICVLIETFHSEEEPPGPLDGQYTLTGSLHGGFFSGPAYDGSTEYLITVEIIDGVWEWSVIAVLGLIPGVGSVLTPGTGICDLQAGSNGYTNDFGVDMTFTVLNLGPCCGSSCSSEGSSYGSESGSNSVSGSDSDSVSGSDSGSDYCSCLDNPLFTYGIGDYRTEAVIVGDGAAEIADDDWYLGNVEFGYSIDGSIEFTVCSTATLSWWVNYDKDSVAHGSLKIFVNGNPTPEVDLSLDLLNPANPAATVTGTIVLPEGICEIPIRVEGMMPTSNDGNIFIRFKVTGVT